jgi:hypothetical protein
MLHNDRVLLALADSQTKSDKSAVAKLINCQLLHRPAQASEATQSYALYNLFFVSFHYSVNHTKR